MPDQVEPAGEGAPPPARFGPGPINGTETRLEVLVDVLDQVLHEVRQLRLDLARLDEVKENDPVHDLTIEEPDTGDSDDLELTEPAPGPKPAARPARKRAAKKAAPGR